MFNLPDKVYDFLSKFQRWLPAIGACYLGLAEVWGLPLADHVSKTITIICTLMASYLEIATVVYEKNKNSVGEEVIRDDAPNTDIVDHEDVDGVG